MAPLINWDSLHFKTGHIVEIKFKMSEWRKKTTKENKQTIEKRNKENKQWEQTNKQINL